MDAEVGCFGILPEGEGIQNRIQACSIHSPSGKEDTKQDPGSFNSLSLGEWIQNRIKARSIPSPSGRGLG